MNDHSLIFDSNLKKYQRQRFARHYGKHSAIFHYVADQITEIIKNEIGTEFSSILEIGARDCYLSKKLSTNTNIKDISISESSKYFLDKNKIFKSYVMENNEIPIKYEKFDLIVNNLNLHWVNDLQKMMKQITSLLNENGIFIGSMFGGKTLHELREAILKTEMESGLSPRISPFTLTKDAGRLLQFAGFKEPVASSEEIKVKYNNAFELMNDLQKMGEGNALIKRKENFTSRGTIQAIADTYHNEFADENGNITATFEVITMIGWR